MTVNELFQDVTYQPVLVRAHSFSPLSPLSPSSDPGRLSPLTMPLSDNDSNKIQPSDIPTWHIWLGIKEIFNDRNTRYELILELN